MRNQMGKFQFLCYFFCILCLATNAQENLNSTKLDGAMKCIYSNGIPNHTIGKFPNKANPNEFKQQNLIFCFPRFPRLTENVTWGLMTVGVTITGIPIRPFTAEYFDPSAKRGYSKNPLSGWRKQAMHDSRSLGIDSHNGHIDRSGLYHYHSVFKQYNDTDKDRLIGYAPDGFKIIFRPSGIASSWQLKSGSRSSAPWGVHDGEFEEDFEYLPKSGALDECNGLKIDNSYTYFATTSYPFFPRCFKGEVNADFMVRN